MPLELARNITVLGADEMQDLDDLPIARHRALSREANRQDHRDKDKSEDHRRDEDDGFRHDGETLEPQVGGRRCSCLEWHRRASCAGPRCPSAPPCRVPTTTRRGTGNSERSRPEPSQGCKSSSDCALAIGAHRGDARHFAARARRPSPCRPRDRGRRSGGFGSSFRARLRPASRAKHR